MTIDEIIRRLADGAWHRVDNVVDCRQQLADVGLQLETDGDRCRLSHPIDMLDAAAISAGLRGGVQLDVVGVVDSTNTRLLRRPPPPAGQCYGLLAEYQYGGRGRHGRAWVSPYGSGLCLSLAQVLEPAPPEPGTLSLAIGVAVLRALRGSGIEGASLKWPNDIQHDSQKLGGILVEAELTGQSLQVIAGVGLNVRLPAGLASTIAAADGVTPTDLHSIDPAHSSRRNQLAAALINNTVAVMGEYQQSGFAPFGKEWNDADVLNGCAVQVSGSTSIAGIASGIDGSGALIVRAGETMHRLTSGDVKVRAT